MEVAWQRQGLQHSLSTDSKLFLPSSPPAQRLNRQQRWEKGGKRKKRKTRKTVAGEKYYIPNGMVWNFLIHVWKNQMSSMKAVLLCQQHHCRGGGSSLPACPGSTGTAHRISVPSQHRAGREQWPALSNSVKGSGPASCLRWGIWDRGLQKALSVHLAY